MADISTLIPMFICAFFDHGSDRNQFEDNATVIAACSVNAFSPETGRKEFGLAFSAAAGVSCMIRGGGNYDLAAVL